MINFPKMPMNDNNKQAFIPDEILKCRIKKGKKQYLIRWKNYSDQDATWEFPSQLLQPLIQKYEDAIKAKKEWKPKTSFSHEVIDSLFELQVKKPQLIVGAFKKDGKLFYRVLFPNEIYHTVPADMLQKVKPILICQFLENKIQFS